MEIRRFKSVDRDQLFNIFRAAFKKDYDLALWKWQFEENPFQPPGNPLIYVVVNGGKIAGSAALLPVPFQIDQQKIPFAWGINLMVHPRFQGRGIAKEPYHYLSRKHEILMSFGATDAAYRVLVKKTEWFKIENFKRLSCYLDPAPYLRKQFPVVGSSLDYISRLPLKPFLSRKVNPTRTRVLQDVIDIGPEFDRLWQEIEPFFPVSVCRTQKYLQWRYQSGPSKNYVFRGLYQKGVLRGYFVLEYGRIPTKNGFSEARLMELLADPNDVEGIAILVQGAIEASVKKQSHVLRCIGAQGNEIHFRRERFYDFPKKDIRVFGTVKADRIAIEKVQNPSFWNLSYGDKY